VDDEHVVVHWANHNGMDFVTGFGKQESHAGSLAGEPSLGGTVRS
jgi:hypothetical protein